MTATRKIVGAAPRRSPGRPRDRFAKLALVLAAAGINLMGAAAALAASGPACSADRGQAFIDAARYQRAVTEFTCVISAQPTDVEGYRGRVEAKVLLGRYADALVDYNLVTTVVMPVHADAATTILDGYAARLAANPDSVPALTGASFAHWWLYDYPPAIQLLNQLVQLTPDDAYGNLFRGSSRLLHNGPKVAGVDDLERGIALAPDSPDVRWVVADAYTYGLVDLERAFEEASLALAWGLDTPRVHSILGTAYNAFGDVAAAATHIERSIELVTTELVTAPALPSGSSLTLDLVPGRTYEIPLSVTAGETVSIVTSSRDMWDTIAVLLDPAGSPVLGSDDDNAYFAAFDWIAPASATYRLRVTSFEAISTGEVEVARS